MKRLLIGLLVIGVLLSACGGAEPTVEELLAESAEVMAGVETVQFIIEREGEPVVLIPEQNISALSAEGVFQSPDSIYATVKVQAGGLVGEAEVIWVGTDVYFKLPPFQPDFGPIATGEEFQPLMIFDEEQGIPYIITEAINAPELVGEEDIEGVMTHHITGEADGEAIQNLVGGAVNAGAVTVDLWIDKDTKEIARILITESDGSTWLIDLYGYGEPVEIPSL